MNYTLLKAADEEHTMTESELRAMDESIEKGYAEMDALQSSKEVEGADIAEIDRKMDEVELKIRESIAAYLRDFYA